MPDDPFPVELTSSNPFPASHLQLLVDSDDEALAAHWLADGEQLKHWVLAALTSCFAKPTAEQYVEVSLSCVSVEAIRSLNAEYRSIDKVTNVLSFPADMPPMPRSDTDETFHEEQQSNEGSEIDQGSATIIVLGDVVICPEVLTNEAQEQGKPIEHHWAHMVIHSILHLNGLDHEDENSADAMESLEIQILSELGITNPYLAASAKQS